MLPAGATIISVGDLVIEHPRVWLDRLPARYSDVAPASSRLPDGNDTWPYEGAPSGKLNRPTGGPVVGSPTHDH